MKKMLVKAVALSLVLGGVGFAANDAQAADISDGVKVYSGTNVGLGHDVKTKTVLEKDTALANQKDLVNVNKDVEANKANITANQKAINQEVKDRQDADSKLDAKINKVATDATVAIKKEESARQTADFQTNLKVDGEIKDRKDADKKLDAKIDKVATDATVAIKKEESARQTADFQTNLKVDGEIKDRKDADNKLGERIDANKTAIDKETADRVKADNDLSDRIGANKTAIENEATTRANEDKRIEAKFDGEVSRLDSRIDKLDANVEKVGAMAAAIANLHTMGYDPEAPTEIAVGVGQYRDKTGLALGAFHYPNRDFMLSFSVSTAGDEFMGGIGATWKFGHKSPEKLRQDEVEKAAKAKLAKAEAAKKAAKDARVAAQQKRHAEMLAARTGK